MMRDKYCPLMDVFMYLKLPIAAIRVKFTEEFCIYDKSRYPSIHSNG